MLGREVDHRTRLDFAQRERARAFLLGVVRPRVRKVAVQIRLVIGQEIRRRHVLAVEVLDDAFRIDLVVRRRIVDRARQQQSRELGRFDHLAAGIAHAHRQREAVAIDVLTAPVRMRARRPFVARNGPHIAARRHHRFCAVGRHPRQHVEPDVAQPGQDGVGQVRYPLLARRAQVHAKDVLGNRQRHARAAQLAGVHVAVDPGTRPRPIGIRAECQEPELPPFRCAADGRHATQFGEGVGPRTDLPRKFVIRENALAKPEREVV